MQMKNKFSFFSLLFVICFFISVGAAASEAKEVKIVTSFYPIYIMAKNVAKDVPGVSIQNLTPTFTGCLHDYALTTNDMKKLSYAQVFIINGAGMESFLEEIIAQLPNLTVIQLSEGMPLIKREANAVDNPHLWVSISGAITQVENLGKAMEGLDPTRQALYAQNTADYVAKLEALRRKMHAELAPYEGKSIITFHEAFLYFAREFGFKIAAVVEREPGSEPSAKELADTIELIKKKEIPALFSEPQYPAAAAGTIAKETGVKLYVLDPAVTGPDEADAYIKIMEENLKVLKQAFVQQ